MTFATTILKHRGKKGRREGLVGFSLAPPKLTSVDLILLILIRKMNNEELSVMQKLELAIKSHKFYNEQCMDMETKIALKIDRITDDGEEPTKKEIDETVQLVNKLLTLSSKYMMEAENVIENVDDLITGKESDMEIFMKNVKEQISSLKGKQLKIHARVEEIQKQLIEMYNMDEDEGTF
ncbi:hypothetical protein CL634_08765 [bacterium]|nr:hypothetical protein [bacterium]